MEGKKLRLVQLLLRKKCQSLNLNFCFSAKILRDDDCKHDDQSNIRSEQKLLITEPEHFDIFGSSEKIKIFGTIWV